MKQTKVIIGLASVLIFTLVVIGLNLSGRRSGDLAVGLSFVGYTNANGTNMALFKVQNNQSRRIWLRHCYYLAGEAFREPACAWQCPDQAASNRWGKSSMDLRQYLPPEPTRNSPDPTNLIIPVPTNQPLWRIGVTVEFNTTLPTRTSPEPTHLTLPVPMNQRLWRIGVGVEFNIGLQQRLRDAWKTRDVKWLDSRHFVNNSPEAIWVESPVITNVTVFSR